MSILRTHRRAPLKSGNLLAGVPFLPLLNAFPAPASVSPRRDCKGYGHIIERACSLLHLPAGFTYYAFSSTGARTSRLGQLLAAQAGTRRAAREVRDIVARTSPEAPG